MDLEKSSEDIPNLKNVKMHNFPVCDSAISTNFSYLRIFYLFKYYFLKIRVDKGNVGVLRVIRKAGVPC